MALTFSRQLIERVHEVQGRRMSDAWWIEMSRNPTIERKLLERNEDLSKSRPTDASYLMLAGRRVPVILGPTGHGIHLELLWVRQSEESWDPTATGGEQ